MTEPPQRYPVGTKVALLDCPSAGTVKGAALHRRISCGAIQGRCAQWRYQVDWPEFPNDERWYWEEELRRAPHR